ncbi:MAG: pyruvate kinase [Gaiellaceae bacterium]
MEKPPQRRTKIVATLGPASSSEEVVRRLVAAGMDAARLNFSHGTPDEHRGLARLVRRAQEQAGRPLALLIDLQGPKVRLGKLAAPRMLEADEQVVLVPEGSEREGELPVAPAVVASALEAGNDVLIDDGLVRLRVEHVSAGRITCRVVSPGTISSHKGINLPGVHLPIPALTEKDRSDLELALELGADFVALSFVHSADDVLELRRLLDERSAEVGIVAKIEAPQAVEALDDLLEIADAVMVARGDLGVEVGPAAVPLLQKRIIARSLERGKPVITATQMLESMVSSPEPTRAEASDVANAILDGSSAIMLSGETAAGRYPVEAVAFMDRIARVVEPTLGYRHEMPSSEQHPSIGQAMSNAACDVAEALQAAAMLVPTFSGRTASAVARLRPRRPIVALSHNDSVLRRLALEWGVTPLPIAASPNIEELWRVSVEAAVAAGLVERGERVVITAGTAVNRPGSTNVIKVEIA